MSPLRGFDQAVAISQKHINESLARRYTLYPTLQAFNVRTDDEEDGAIQAQMLPPTVDLYFPGEPRKAYFSLHFKSGTFDYYAKRSGETQKSKHTLSVTGWKLVFIAKLTRQDLQTLPSDVMDNMLVDMKKNITNKPGSYSLSQILIDLTTADAVDWEALRSETPGMNPAVGEDIRAKAALRQLLFIYVSQLAKESLSILGYSITVKDPKDANPVMPSLPPVSVSTQTMPASVDSGSPGKSGDSNAFLFLEMAGDVTGRTAPLNALEGSYAWVRDDESGVMLIGKESLWDRFFVGHLKFINEEALVLVNKLGRWVETGGKEGGSVGDAIPWSLTDSSFPNNLEWTSRDQTSASFSWHDGKKNDKSDWGFGWTSHKREQWDASVKTNVRMDPGTNHLTVNNSISFQYQQANDSTHGRGDTISDLRTEAASVDWDLILAFNSVKGGVLGFDVQVQNLKCSCNLSTQTFGVFQALFGGIIVDDKGKEIMESLIESRMNQIDLAGLVSKALKEQSQFVFPGGGTFFMKDPTFTPDYDLRVSLNYQQRREDQGVTK